MKLFVTIFNDFQPLQIVTKSSILDVAGVLDPTTITDIFISQSLILINFKPICASSRNRSIDSNGKEDDQVLCDGNNNYLLHEVLTFN